MEIYAPEIFEMFVYKHIETVEYLKKYATFSRGKVIRELLGLKMQNSQSIASLRSRSYTEIFKSALVYL